MVKKKSMKRIAAETGLVGIFGFAGGWAIAKIILDQTTTDPNKDLYAGIIGMASGAALATASSGYKLKWISIYI